MTSVPSVRQAGQDTRWFQRHLLQWSHHHQRNFTWRRQRDPYAILIAEIMLHRTRASQVEPVYLRFLEHFPRVADLAAADDTSVRELAAPLGLEWRAANFVPLARALMERYAGRVPSEREALLALPGVGPYVADAVRVFAFGESAALVDSNTVRVAGRYFGFATHSESRRQRGVRDAVAALVDPRHSRESNLALLDFAAAICTPRNPLCDRCPVSAQCHYAARELRRGHTTFVSDHRPAASRDSAPSEEDEA